VQYDGKIPVELIRKFWRYGCYFLYIAFLRFTPEDYRPYSLGFPLIRSFLVSQFAEHCGKQVRVKHDADVSPAISIGNYSELGTHCFINAGVEIGDYVIMGPNVKIYSRNHRFEDTKVPIALQGSVTKKTRIGDDIWIGANVVILPGVTVGSHCVIGAGAVVTKDIPAWSVVGGNPARVIRDRRGARP